MNKTSPFTKQPFQGFSPQGLKFLHNLNAHNNRDWFAKHRDDYLQFVSEPMKQLVMSLSPMISELDPLVITAPNRAVSRIYRDTRFSNDKTPYRPRLWFAFKREVEYWTETPTYFFQLEEKQYMYGMGMYSASAATMRRFRAMIDDNPEFFLRITEPVRKSRTLKLETDQYKRRLPFQYPEKYSITIDPWYQSKSIAVLAHREPDKTLLSSKLVNLLMEHFVLLKPLYDFLWKSVVLR
ncbi:MAG: DUF2461 domain-containing protein [Planctomycetaceae bacterium]|jgi:uncharacterized protein (TIGR02453 family)|nr:DUF2461 domain-containing protein [Planctomycetaceae bacterium]